MSDPTQTTNDSTKSLGEDYDAGVKKGFDATQKAPDAPTGAGTGVVNKGADVPPAPSLGDDYEAGKKKALDAAQKTPDAKPDAPTGAVTGLVDKGKALAETLADKAKTGAKDLDKKLEDKDAWGNIKSTVSEFFDKFPVGKVLGGIIGILGAWFLGGMFGDGIIGTIMMALLAIPLMMIGGDKLGGMIDDMLGTKQASTGGQSQQRTVAQGGQANQTAVGATMTLTEADMHKMLEQQKPAAGPQGPELMFVTHDGKNYTHIPAQALQESFDTCRNTNGFIPELSINMDQHNGNITPTCLPRPASNSQGRFPRP